MWSAISNNTPALTITSQGSGGTADIDFTVQGNASATNQQMYSLTITPMTGNALTYTLTEAGAPCTFSPTAPTTASINIAQAGIGSNSPAMLTMSTQQNGCAAPAPVSYANWLHIVTNPGPTFDGTNFSVSYYVDANAASMSRTGTIQIANELFTVTQAGAACAFSLNAYGTAFGQAGGPGMISASESALGCPLTPSTDQPSIVTQVTQSPPASGGDVFTENYTIGVFNSLVNAIRTAQIVLGGQIFTVKQTSW
jgi:hypothetical protein